MIALLLITLTAQAGEKEITYIDFEERDLTAKSPKPSINFVFETKQAEFKPLTSEFIISPMFVDSKRLKSIK